MFKRILVPLDGSAVAEKALFIAENMVKEQQGELLLISIPTMEQALAPPAGFFDTYHLVMSTDVSRKRMEVYLAQKKAEMEQRGLATRTKVVSGLLSVAEMIATTADVENADIIVMTSHGYTGIRRLVLGSVAESVLHHAYCPVLVIPLSSVEFQEQLIENEHNLSSDKDVDSRDINSPSLNHSVDVVS